MKAEDIPDELLPEVIKRLTQEWPLGPSIWAVAEAMPAYPEKVVVAKARRLMRRGILDGCICLNCGTGLQVVDRPTR